MNISSHLNSTEINKVIILSSCRFYCQ